MESLLLASPLLLMACEAVLGHLDMDGGPMGSALRAVVAAAVAAAKGE